MQRNITAAENSQNAQSTEALPNPHLRFFSRKRSISEVRSFKYPSRSQLADKLNAAYQGKKQYFNSHIVQPECVQDNSLQKAYNRDLSNQEDPGGKQQKQQKQPSKNQAYLMKMRNMRRMMVNQGISLYSPEKAGIEPEELSRDEYRGLNRFTNIVIKRLESKCNKVSFSEFLEIKKERDFQTKFKFILQKKASLASKEKNEQPKNIDPLCFGHFEELGRDSKNHVLQDRRSFAKSRFKDSAKLQEHRYQTLSGLSDSLAVNSSLEISKLQLKH